VGKVSQGGGHYVNRPNWNPCWSKKTLQVDVNQKQEVLGGSNRLFSFDTSRTAYRTTPPAVLFCVHIRCRGNMLLSRCLATVGAYTYGHTGWLVGFMKYAVETGSGVMINIPCFIKIGSAIQKLMEWEWIDRQTAWRSHKPTFFIKKNERGFMLSPCCLCLWIRRP
jgi:hypothetical protein